MSKNNLIEDLKNNRISYLKINNGQFNFNDIEEILRELFKHNNSIKVLDLKDVNLNLNCFQLISDILLIKNIKACYLDNTGLTDYSVVFLVNVLKNNIALRKFSATNNNFDSQEIINAISNNQYLHERMIYINLQNIYFEELNARIKENRILFEFLLQVKKLYSNDQIKLFSKMLEDDELFDLIMKKNKIHYSINYYNQNLNRMSTHLENEQAKMFVENIEDHVLPVLTNKTCDLEMNINIEIKEIDEGKKILTSWLGKIDELEKDLIDIEQQIINKISELNFVSDIDYSKLGSFIVLYENYPTIMKNIIFYLDAFKDEIDYVQELNNNIHKPVEKEDKMSLSI